MSSWAMKLENVTRNFAQGESLLHVLKGANLDLKVGEIVSLVGPSGAGKSTLLQIAGLLEPPTDGEVYIGGQLASGLSDDKRTAIRRHHMGFVYQYHHLLPEFTALENVALPQMIAGVKKGVAEERGRDLLTRMGLGARTDHRPGQLSGGEQQRVAICRALANKPKVLLADEPTGNLDPETSGGVFKELLRLVREEGLSAVIATHNPDLAKSMDRVIRLDDGRLA